nr:hypothetical protein [Tanacetum cinerariifolium]
IGLTIYQERVTEAETMVLKALNF